MLFLLLYLTSVSCENICLKSEVTSEEQSYTMNIGMVIVVSPEVKWKYNDYNVIQQISEAFKKANSLFGRFGIYMYLLDVIYSSPDEKFESNLNQLLCEFSKTKNWIPIFEAYRDYWWKSTSDRYQGKTLQTKFANADLIVYIDKENAPIFSTVQANKEINGFDSKLVDQINPYLKCVAETKDEFQCYDIYDYFSKSFSFCEDSPFLYVPFENIAERLTKALVRFLTRDHVDPNCRCYQSQSDPDEDCINTNLIQHQQNCTAKALPFYGSCLFDIPPDSLRWHRPSCGNGRIEDGEQCDSSHECCTSDCQFYLSENLNDSCIRYVLLTWSWQKWENFNPFFLIKLIIQENGLAIELFVHRAVTVYLLYLLIKLINQHRVWTKMLKRLPRNLRNQVN